MFTKPDFQTLQSQLAEMLRGGFAPVVVLLREFNYQKSGVVVEDLPFSVWSLLEHMRHRQKKLLAFIKDPENNLDLWPKAYWPENPVPENEQEWLNAIDSFEQDLEEMIKIVENPEAPLFDVQKNGHTISYAALINLHHNAYTIGQVKAIGRQLGVW